MDAFARGICSNRLPPTVLRKLEPWSNSKLRFHLTHVSTTAAFGLKMMASISNASYLRHYECSTMKQKRFEQGSEGGAMAQLTFSCTTLMRNSWLSVSLLVLA